jgi:LmbE family N-acetylglucosaminyl deacetylase
MSKKILVFAPHPDDEVLGCGGTLARHSSEGDQVFLCIVTRGRPPVFQISDEILKSQPHTRIDDIERSNACLGIKMTYFLEYPAVMLEAVPRHELNRSISDVISEVKPDIVYMPHFGDLQKDHGITADAVMVAIRPTNSFRVHKVYAYETLSETEWSHAHSKNSFLPDTYVNIEDYLDVKIDAMRQHQSQLHEFPFPRSIEAIIALAKLRGSTMGCKAAEAFSLIREYRY